MVRYAVIVDGYQFSYANMPSYASAFRARGVEPVAVMSTAQPIPQYLPRWFPEKFAAVHFYDGDFDALVALVKQYDPVCIIPGQEVGVEMAAALVEVLMPEKGNLPGTAICHRDKGEMAWALERAGVPRLRTIRSADPHAIAAWVQENNLQDKALVVKPPKSGGTDGVHFVGPGKNWRPYFDKLLGIVNDLGLINDEIVVQEYAAGTEYIVDMYTVAGEHSVVDICRYAKHDRDVRIGIYDCIDYVAPDPQTHELVAYAKQAATALGIMNGPTHIELMLTADGPRLIELGARHSGGPAMLASTMATGDNQISRAVRHHLDGEHSTAFELVQPVRIVFLSSEQTGNVTDIEILEGVAQLPTVFELSLPPNGKEVHRTYDFHTSLGWIIQAAPDWADITADYDRIRELERQWNACQVGAR